MAIINGTPGPGAQTGTEDNDIFDARGGDDTLTALGGNDTIDAGSGNDTLYGDGGNDLLIAGTGDDTLYGGTGNDTLRGDAGNDYIDGQNGEDTVSYVLETGGATIDLALGRATDGTGDTDTLVNVENATGSAFSDTITGNDGNNTLSGGTGQDTLSGRGGSDYIDGGGDADTVTYALAGSGAVIRLDGVAGADGDGGFDTLVNIEYVIGSDFSDDITGTSGVNQLRGGAGNDEIFGLAGADILLGQAGSDSLDGGDDDDQLEGGAGDDILLGGAGHDSLTGGAGNDTIDGGSGIDTLFLEDNTDPDANATSFTVVDLNAGVISADGIVGTGGVVGTDIVLNIENVIGTDQNDTITGTNATNTLVGGNGADVLRGLGGSDTLNGGSGADSLFGGSGPDFLIGGAGRDLLHGGDGFDRVDYSGETTRLYLHLGIGTGQTTADNVDTFFAVEHIIGTNLADTMIGDKFGNLFDAGAGNDVIVGAGGIDTLNGGDGDDDIQGGSGNDIINGDLGNDFLRGGLGDDTLTGGLGNDTLNGGGGVDTFNFSGSWGNDVVQASGSINVIVIEDYAGVDINSAPSNNDLVLSFPTTESVRLENYIGHEGEFIVVDRDGYILNVGTTGTSFDTALIVPSQEDEINGRVGATGNAEDFYTFVAPTDGTITATISGVTAGAVVSFFNRDGGFQGSAIAAAGGIASIDLDVARSDTYFVSVAAQTVETTYNLTLDLAAEVSNSLATPTNVALPLQLDDVVVGNSGNTADVYRIVAPQDGTFVANISGVNGDVDLRIRDSLGNILKESAQTGTLGEGASITAIAGTAYIVEVVPKPGAVVTYDIQLTLEDLDDTGANGSIATAQDLAIGATVEGEAGVDPNFADYYAVSTSSAGQITINLTDLNSDLRLDLFDSDGQRIGQAQTGGAANETLVQTVGAGDYFIGVVAVGNNSPSTYDLSTSFAIADAGNTIATASTFAGLPLDMTQTVGGTDAADYYSYTAPANGSISVDMSQLTGNIGLQAFDQNGIRIASDVTGGAVDKAVVFNVIGGQTYYFGAIPVGDSGAGSYRIEAAYEQDAGNSLSAPTNVDGTFSRTASIGFGTDTDDNYRLFPSEDGTLTVNLSNISAPVDLHLYTADGTRLTSSRNGGVQNEQISFDLEANVAYVIAVTPTSGDAAGFYDINASFSSSPAASAATASAQSLVDENSLLS